jgi:hypothetical protein
MTKEELIALAKKKGFESEFLYNKPYKYSNKEELRWLFWLVELNRWMYKLNNNIFNRCIELDIKTLEQITEDNLIFIPDEK